jgi:5'-3' exoribonuclease 1
MMLAIFRYIDRMVTEIAKPKKLLFMAIDGVAPRAKLNQQRARRFRAAQERMESIQKAKQRGDNVDEEAMFDSNCITPGTEFMEIVGKHLRWFIRKKIKEDSLWKNLEVVFSGHDVPGEGEHKIMQYIREARAKEGYLPNQRHCMYGGDADLIMLGLATHEPHFTLLREVVDFSGGKGGSKFGGRQTVIRQTREVQYQLMNLCILREYILLDLSIGTGLALDGERLCDDFIFLTFLVGNDFLPHLPTLDIGEHAFDVIFKAYKEMLTTLGEGYIVNSGEIGDMARLEKLFSIIGVQELDILQNREAEAKEFATKRRKFKDSNMLTEEEVQAAEEAKQRAYDEALQALETSVALGYEEPSDDGADEEGFVLARVRKAAKEKEGDPHELDRPLECAKDFKGRYYYEKFKVLPGAAATKIFFGKLRESYLQGLMWCLAYYVKGCISWTWYFPYHYGPMLQVSDAFSHFLGRNLGQIVRPKPR